MVKCRRKFSILLYVCIIPPPDSTLTVENIFGVMEKVTDGRAKEVWRRLLRSAVLKDINSKCSTDRELVNACADIYVNCTPYSSWEEVALALYREGETAAVEEIRSYLNLRGTCRFSLWAWFVV